MSERFDLRLSLAAIRGGDRIDLVATDEERAAIADRFGLLGLSSLKAHAVLDRDGDAITAEGRVQAQCEQACVATGATVPAAIDEPFALTFLPEPVAEPDQEIELGGDEMDVVFHDGAAIPLGAALVDTLALALDPYPRSAEAGAALREAGVLSEEEAGPFAALAALKDRMGGETP